MRDPSLCSSACGHGTIQHSKSTSYRIENGAHLVLSKNWLDSERRSLLSFFAATSIGRLRRDKFEEEEVSGTHDQRGRERLCWPRRVNGKWSHWYHWWGSDDWSNASRRDEVEVESQAWSGRRWYRRRRSTQWYSTYYRDTEQNHQLHLDPKLGRLLCDSIEARLCRVKRALIVIIQWKI